MEIPLNLQLNHGNHQSYMELRVVQLRDSLSAPPLSAIARGAAANDSDSGEDTVSESSNPNLIPKEEGDCIIRQLKLLHRIVWFESTLGHFIVLCKAFSCKFFDSPRTLQWLVYAHCSDRSRGGPDRDPT